MKLIKTGKDSKVKEASLLLPWHRDLVCNCCHGDIQGMRYKCLECKDYDLCYQCEKEGQHNEHDMIRFISPLDFLDPKSPEVHTDRNILRQLILDILKSRDRDLVQDVDDDDDDDDDVDIDIELDDGDDVQNYDNCEHLSDDDDDDTDVQNYDNHDNVNDDDDDHYDVVNEVDGHDHVDVDDIRIKKESTAAQSTLPDQQLLFDSHSIHNSLTPVYPKPGTDTISLSSVNHAENNKSEFGKVLKMIENEQSLCRPASFLQVKLDANDVHLQALSRNVGKPKRKRGRPRKEITADPGISADDDDDNDNTEDDNDDDDGDGKDVDNDNDDNNEWNPKKAASTYLNNKRRVCGRSKTRVINMTTSKEDFPVKAGNLKRKRGRPRKETATKLDKSAATNKSAVLDKSAGGNRKIHNIEEDNNDIHDHNNDYDDDDDDTDEWKPKKAAKPHFGKRKRGPPKSSAPKTAISADVSVDTPGVDSSVKPGKRKLGRPRKDEIREKTAPIKYKRNLKHICPYCSRAFYWTGHLEIHIRSHTGEKPLSCDKCTLRFSTPSGLRTHMKSHDGRKLLLCSYCGVAFSYRSVLNRHIIAKHTDYKPYTCSICNYRTIDKYTLKYHVRNHSGEKPYKCEICGKRFKVQKGLLGHTNARHTTEQYVRNFHCRTCGKSMRSKSTLVAHERRHLVKLTDSFEPLVHCSQCDRTFSSKKHLNGHLERHKLSTSNDRFLRVDCPFQCPVCSRKFKSPETLRQHEHSHKGSYMCRICQTSFSTNYSLRRHMKVHSEKRPFSCTQCVMHFKSSLYLKNHIKNIHSFLD